MTRPIPEGFHTITPMLNLVGAADAIEFFNRAFGAEEIRRIEPIVGELVARRVRHHRSYRSYGTHETYTGAPSRRAAESAMPRFS